MIALAVEICAGKIKVMAGTGANSTKEAIYLTQEAEKLVRMRRCRLRLITTSPRRRVVPTLPCGGVFDPSTDHPFTASRVGAASRSAWTQ